MATPAKLIVPAIGGSSPNSVFSNVDLPAPLRPNTAVAPMGGIFREMSNKAWLRPYPALRPSASRRRVTSDTGRIHLLHLDRALDGLDIALIQHPALVEHGQPIADVADEMQVMLDDDQGAV